MINQDYICDELIAIVYGNEIKTSNEILTAFRNVNTITEPLAAKNIDRIIDSIIYSMETRETDVDFINVLTTECIHSQIGNSYFIAYAKLRALTPGIEEYTRFLQEILTTSIIFPTEKLQSMFYAALMNMVNVIENPDLTLQIETYISK